MLALVIIGPMTECFSIFKMNRDITDVSTYARHFKDLIGAGVRGQQ